MTFFQRLRPYKVQCANLEMCQRAKSLQGKTSAKGNYALKGKELRNVKNFMKMPFLH